MAYRTRSALSYMNRCLLYSALKDNIGICSKNSLRLPTQQRNTSSSTQLLPFPSKPRCYSTHSIMDSFDNIMNDDNVRYFDSKHELKTMKFSELKELAKQQYNEKGRNLVKVKVSGDKANTLKQTPTFRTLNIKELEELVRKNRQNHKQQFFEIIEPIRFLPSEILSSDPETPSKKSGKVRYKQVSINVGIADHDVQVAAKRIIKLLSNQTTIVTLNIKSKGKAEEGALLEKSIKSHLGNDVANDNLIMNIS